MTNNDSSRISNIALMIDFDNTAISAEQFHNHRFDIGMLVSSLRDRGRIIVKRAYADWKKWTWYQNALLNNAIEMVHVPFHSGSNKNNSDIKMAVDAMETVYRNPLIDTFVIVSGDSDFQSLVTKLRENGKYVITIGVKQATSDLLIFNSDEFISYESIMGIGGKKDADEGFVTLIEVMESTMDKGLLSLSNIKNLLLQKDPSFNEREYGYSQFKDFILAAEECGHIEIERGRGREMYFQVAQGAEDIKKEPGHGKGSIGPKGTVKKAHKKGPRKH